MIDSKTSSADVLQKVFEEILDTISSQVDTRVITHVDIDNYEIALNNKCLDVKDILNDFGGPELAYLIDFKTLARYFPNMTALTLNSDVAAKVLLDHNDMLEHIFGAIKSLKVIYIQAKQARAEYHRNERFNRNNISRINDRLLQSRIEHLYLKRKEKQAWN